MPGTDTVGANETPASASQNGKKAIFSHLLSGAVPHPGWRIKLRSLFAVSSDPFLAERIVIARRVEQVSVVAVLGLAALLPLRPHATWVDWVLYPTVGLVLGLMHLLRPRLPAVAGFVGGAGLIVLITVAAWYREGLGSGATSGAYALAVVIGGLLWGPGKTLVLAVLASSGGALLAWTAPQRPLAPLRSWAELTAICFTLGLFVESMLSALSERITEARTTRKRFQQLFDGSPDALIVLDRRGVVQLFNRAAQALIETGLEPGVTLSTLPQFQGDNAPILRTVVTTDLDTGIQRIPGLESLEAPLSLARGRFHELTVSPLIGMGGELKDTLLLTIRDVTERVDATRARRDFEAQLAKSKSLEALGRLAGGVAHDFNNLLTVIIGTTDLLLHSSNLDAQVRSDLLGIKSSAGQAAELTSQLLAFGRKQILEPSVFCPTDSVFQLQPLLHRLIPSNITLLVNPEHNLGHVRIDPARLDQVLVNLVTNSCDSMPNGGTLTLETNNVEITTPTLAAHAGGERETVPQGSYVALAVVDTGTGMNGETLARIFEPFFTTKALGKGTGLGLATVFGIVRQSGGYIRVSTQLGHGTRFELLFPRVDPSGKSLPPIAEASMRPHSLRVLVVDSNAAVRASIAEMLETSGHRVTLASDSENAAHLLQSGDRFDLLVTDARLAGNSGLQLASTLVSQHPSLRVLLITSETDSAHDLSTAPIPYRQQRFLPRPFTKRLLNAKIGELYQATPPP